MHPGPFGETDMFRMLFLPVNRIGKIPVIWNGMTVQFFPYHVQRTEWYPANDIRKNAGRGAGVKQAVGIRKHAVSWTLKSPG